MIYIVNVNELDSLRLGYDGRVRNLIKILDKSGIENLAITNNIGHINKIKHVNFNYPGYKIIKTIQYKKNISLLRFLSNVIFSFKLVFYLGIKLKDNDRVVINSIPPEILGAVSLLKKILRIDFKIILDVRDLWPYAYRMHKKSFAINLWSYFCTFLMKSGLKNVSHLIVVSKQYINVINELGYKKDYTYLPLGFDKNRWKPIKICENENLTGFYIGNENNQINLDTTFKQLDGLFKRIIIVGRHDKKINLSKTNLIYEGLKDPESINKIIMHCHYGILPSLDQSGAGLPNKLFDYMGALLPVIAFGNDEAAQFVTRNKIGLVHSKNLVSCNVIEQHKSLRENLSKVRNSFSTDYLYSSYKEIIMR